MIALTINGKPQSLDDETPLPQLLVTLEIDVRLVAVAINGEVIPKNQHGGVTLRDGDVVEIVRMVGGGASRPTMYDPRPADGAGTGGEVVVVGADIIACSIAYELSRRGVSCLVLDSRRIGMAATNAAAGILAPLAEFRRPDELVRLGLASLWRYPQWVERLREEVPDIDVEFDLNGVLRVAFDEEELAGLRTGLRYQDELGMEVIELDAAMVREVEPRLSPKIVGGLLCPEEGQVSNQLFTLALARAAKARGVRIIEGCPALAFRTRGGRVTAVRTP